MAEAGYSGTPLLKKLGVKDGQRALLIGAPDIEALDAFDGWKSVRRAKHAKKIAGGPFDYIHIFCADLDAYAEAVPALKRVLDPGGMIWASWPKKSSGVPTTLLESDVRTIAIRNGLVDIKVCAVDDVWSGLKLVIPVKDRPQ